MYFCSFTFYYGHFSGGGCDCGPCLTLAVVDVVPMVVVVVLFLVVVVLVLVVVVVVLVGSASSSGPHQTSSSGRGTLLLEGGSLPLSLSLTKYNL